jgi:hypothetical protein
MMLLPENKTDDNRLHYQYQVHNAEDHPPLNQEECRMLNIPKKRQWVPLTEDAIEASLKRVYSTIVALINECAATDYDAATAPISVQQFDVGDFERYLTGWTGTTLVSIQAKGPLGDLLCPPLDAPEGPMGMLFLVPANVEFKMAWAQNLKKLLDHYQQNELPGLLEDDDEEDDFEDDEEDDDTDTESEGEVDNNEEVEAGSGQSPADGEAGKPAAG